MRFITKIKKNSIYHQKEEKYCLFSNNLGHLFRSRSNRVIEVKVNYFGLNQVRKSKVDNSRES